MHVRLHIAEQYIVLEFLKDRASGKLQLYPGLLIGLLQKSEGLTCLVLNHEWIEVGSWAAWVCKFAYEVDQEEAAAMRDGRFVPEQVLFKLGHFLIVSHPVLLLSSVESHQLKQRLTFVLLPFSNW